jgi:hypothetical protein
VIPIKKIHHEDDAIKHPSSKDNGSIISKNGSGDTEKPEDD